MTVITVANDQKRRPEESEIATFARRTLDLQRRFCEGKLDPELVLANIQSLSEGRAMAEEAKAIEQEQRKQIALSSRLRPLGMRVKLNAMPRMKVMDCLKKGITWRDGDLDNWLSASVPAMGEGIAEPHELTDQSGTTYRQMAEAILGMTGSDEELKKSLKERGLTFHPEQVADLLRRTKDGEDTGILKNGYANLFFIEDENGEVFGLYAFWYGDWPVGGWHVRVYSFGYGCGWDAGYRFCSRNKA